VASNPAIAIPASGQSRYEYWKTLPRKRRRNIEAAKPTAPTHGRRDLSWLRTSQSVTGNQTSSARSAKGYAEFLVSRTFSRSNIAGSP
jgi:hypothetical protein